MIKFKESRCPCCHSYKELLPSNNPIAASICLDCIQQQIDPSNLEQADFFCRTYNIPFNPSKWVELYEKCGDTIFKHYLSMFYETNTENLYYQPATKDLWKKLNDEWSQCQTYEQLLSKVEPVKNKFIERNKLKWGDGYSFEQYLQLESLLTSTLKAGDVSNPLRIDAIKKACRISIELDKAIEMGDSRGIKDLSASYSSFTKAAQLDEVIATDNKDVITTVADLADYIEKCGGEYHYYDNVSRDIVDKTIADIKEYLRVLVTDATGLGATLENITNQYKQNLENNAAQQSIQNMPLEELMRGTEEASNPTLDSQLEQESLDDIPLDDTDDYI